MQTEYKYFRKTPVAEGCWSNRWAEQERLYDLVLIDIIDNGMNHTEACYNNGVVPTSFVRVVFKQRKLGLNIPAFAGGIRANKFDPNGIYKYWVVPATSEGNQTVEYGKMMDAAIQQNIDGKTVSALEREFGLKQGTISHHIHRCRVVGSPIPNIPARGQNTPNTEASPDIFYNRDGHNAVKPHIVLEWVDKRLQGYPCTWIAGEYGVTGRTVLRLTKPFVKTALGKINA